MHIIRQGIRLAEQCTAIFYPGSDAYEIDRPKADIVGTAVWCNHWLGPTLHCSIQWFPDAYPHLRGRRGFLLREMAKKKQEEAEEAVPTLTEIPGECCYQRLPIPLCR